MVNEPTPSTLIRWIPALPLFAALLHAVALVVVRRPFTRGVVVVTSCGAVATSFVMSVLAFSDLLRLDRGSRALLDTSGSWFGLGAGVKQFGVDVAFRFDALSGSLVLVITGIAVLLHVYAAGFMEDDDRPDSGFERFFCLMSLLLTALLTVVLAEDPVLLFFGWQGVSISSAALIAFWYSDTECADAGRSASILGYLSDGAMLAAIVALFWSLVGAGVVAHGFGEIAAGLPLIAEDRVALPMGLELPLLDLIGAGFLVAVCCRAAQVPFYFWLPRSARAPLPALTFVVLAASVGVYVVGRLSFVWGHAAGATSVVAWVAVLTALGAGLAALAQGDIVRVVVYCGLSRLSVILVAASCGAQRAAASHHLSWALTQTLLFLTVGAVVHGLKGEHQLRRMGGLRERFVWTHGAMLIAVLSPAALLSLEEIHHSIWISGDGPGARGLYGLTLVSAALVCAALFRVVLLAFWGGSR